MLQINHIKRRDIFILLIILIVAGFLRYANPEIIDWSKDHSDAAMLARDAVSGKNFPFVGNPSSAGIPNSPLFIYVLIPPYMLTDNPIVVTMFIATLNLLGVGLLWFIAYRYFGSTTAFITGMAYAVNPWVLTYSRTIWSGDHRVPLVILGVLLGLLGFLEGKRWAQVLCLPVMLLGLQVHYAALTLFPLYLWLLWIGRKQTSLRIMAISAVLGFLVILPFTIGITETLTSNAGLGNQIKTQDRDFSLRNLVKPYGQFAWLATGMGLEQYTVRENAEDFLNTANLPWIIWGLNGIFIAIGAVAIFRRAPRNLAITILIWAFWQVLVFTIPFIDIFPHYFLPSIPALAILIGIGGTWTLDWFKNRVPIVRIAIIGVLGTIFLTQGLFFRSLLNYVDTHYTPTQFSFGTPIHYLVPVIENLKQDQNIVFITSSDWVDFSRTGSWVFAPFLYDTVTCLRDVIDTEHVAVFPNTPFAVVFAPRISLNTSLEAMYQTASPTTIELRPGEGVYQINDFDQSPEWSGVELTEITPVNFDNGLKLTGYHLGDDQIMFEWQLPASSKINYQLVVDFLDSNGESLGKQPFTFWASTNWCEGDRLINWVDTSIPDGTQTVQVSILVSELNQIVKVVNAAGNVTGESVDLNIP